MTLLQLLMLPFFFVIMLTTFFACKAVYQRWNTNYIFDKETDLVLTFVSQCILTSVHHHKGRMPCCRQHSLPASQHHCTMKHITAAPLMTMKTSTAISTRICLSHYNGTVTLSTCLSHLFKTVQDS